MTIRTSWTTVWDMNVCEFKFDELEIFDMNVCELEVYELKFVT